MAGKSTDSKPRGRAAQKVFAAFDLEPASDVAEDEHVSFATDSGRNENQIMVDADMIDLHKKWVAAGRPPFTRSTLSQATCPVPRKRYTVNPDATEAIDTYLTRAANLYGLTVIKAPVKRSEDGRAMIYWAVKDKKDRTAAEVTNETEAENTAQDQEG